MHPIVYVLVFAFAAAVVVFLAGIRIVRPTHRGLVESNPMTLSRRPRPWSAPSCRP